MLGRRVRHAERQILTPLFSAPQNLSRLKTDEKENKKWKTKKRNHQRVPHATTNTPTFYSFYRRPCHHNIALYRNRLASALLAPLWQSGCV